MQRKSKFTVDQNNEEPGEQKVRFWTLILMSIFHEKCQSLGHVKMQNLPCNTPLFLVFWPHPEPPWRLKKENVRFHGKWIVSLDTLRSLNSGISSALLGSLFGAWSVPRNMYFFGCQCLFPCSKHTTVLDMHTACWSTNKNFLDNLPRRSWLWSKPWKSLGLNHTALCWSEWLHFLNSAKSPSTKTFRHKLPTVTRDQAGCWHEHAREQCSDSACLLGPS